MGNPLINNIGNNPMNILEMLRSGSPKDIVFRMLGNLGNQPPEVKQLLEWAKNGDTKKLIEYGNKKYAAQGRNFENELSNFMNNK